MCQGDSTPQVEASGISMHRRPAVVVFAAGQHLEAFFQAGEAAAVLVEFELLPGINAAAAQVEVAERHAAEMGQVSDAALAGGY